MPKQNEPNENIHTVDEKIPKDKIPKQKLGQEQLLVGKKDSPLGVPANLDIDDEKWNKIQGDIKDYLDAIRADKQEMEGRIVDWQLAIQGEPTDVDFQLEPFKDSCKLRSTLTGTSCRIIENKITRTILVEPYYLAEVKGDKEAEARLRDYANHKCKHDFDFRDIVRQVVHLAVESPAAILVPERVREVRTDIDYVIYEDFKEFKIKYPNAESTNGLTESEYQAKLKNVEADIEKQGYYESYYSIDVVTEKSDVKVVHIVNFVKFPWATGDFNDAKLIGHFIDKTYDQLVRLEQDHQIKNVNKLKQFYVDASSTTNNDVIQEIQNDKVGMNAAPQTNINNYKTKVYRIVKGLVRLGLDDAVVEKDYEFWYSPDEGILLRIAPYISNYKKRNYIPGVIWKKTNSWVGESIPEQAENPQRVCDTLLRQFVDGNSMANIPEYVGSLVEKRQLEESDEGFEHFTGRIWWLKNPTAFQALRSQRPDGSSFLSLLQFIMQDYESRVGASRSAAGQPLAEDPEAPGVKTMALLQQSDFMIGVYIDQLRPAFDEMMKHLIKQDRQWFKDKKVLIDRPSINGNVAQEEIGRNDLQFLDPDTKFTLRNQKIDDNATLRKQEGRQDLEFYSVVPIIKERTISQRILLRNALMRNDNYTIEEIDELVPTEETLKQEAAEVQAEAIKVMQAQQKTEQLNQEIQDQSEQQEETITNQIRQEPIE